MNEAPPLADATKGVATAAAVVANKCERLDERKEEDKSCCFLLIYICIEMVKSQ
ncbi:MAG: hypothetical protein ACEY26_00835 [Candidatus Hodgkinia cicadicola]